MERPVMNPTYLEPVEPPKPKRRPFRAVARFVWSVVTFNVWRLLPGQHHRHDDDPFMQRLIRWLLIRSAAAITAVCALAGGLVYYGTHPTTYASGADPASLGLFYERAVLSASDGLPYEAWLVPVLDARMVLAQREYALGRPRPAAILLHDFGQTREQLLPLIKPLHDAGMVVLVPAMRSSAGGPAAGHTFGLQESRDVLGAIAALRQRAYVDGKNIILVGTGTGATAALLAAKADASIRAVVVRQPIATGDELLAVVGPQDPQLSWLAPVCKWTFELCYNVDADEINGDRQTQECSTRLLALRPNDYLYGRQGPKTTRQVSDFIVLSTDGPQPAVADVKAELSK